MSSSADRTVLVTGATGFIGRHLVPALGEDGFRVIQVSRRGGSPGVRVMDVTDPDQVKRIFEEVPPPAAVVHLAALAHGNDRFSPRTFDEVNHLGLRNVLAAAVDRGVPRFVHFSSSNVYGERDDGMPIPESEPCEPSGGYGLSKHAAELACEEMAGRIECVVLRFPALYSREWLFNVRRRAYLPGLARRMLFRVPGRQPRYSLCSVEHAVAVTRMALDPGSVPAGVYNVSDGEPYTQAEVAAIVGHLDGVSHALPVPRPVVAIPVAVGERVLPARLGTRLRSNYRKVMEGNILDISKIERFGFRPTARLTDLDDRPIPSTAST
jgi:UDP-glucose 4-epimerase